MTADTDCVEIIEGDLSDVNHQQALIELTTAYMNDEMGEGRALTATLKTQLISGLIAHPAVLLFFAEYYGKLIGLATCFIGFSTFHAKKLINIHDLIVLPEYRHKGVAKKILLFLEEKAKLMGCCKLTLEVRTDNTKALGLYKKFGFSGGKHLMYFWTKML